ncbi:HEWD family protein, partial [Halogeometricum borinquense]
GERQVGSPYCIHEWDINGTFAPFEDKNAHA